ncbi:MAG: 4Fe-4S dicluster domain-containing protein, partial [Candidatus Hodarchaeota archaeon]
MAESESESPSDTKPEVLNLNEVDQAFIMEIVKAGGENVFACYQCGTCTAGCPAGWKTAFKIRTILRKSILGLKKEVISDRAIWNCTTCYTCYDRCPRDVR